MNQTISLLFKALFTARMTLSFLLRSRKEKTGRKYHALDNRDLVFVVRLYGEQNSIPSLLQRYSRVLKLYAGTFLIFACSAKERYNKSQQPTADVIHKLIIREEFNEIRDRCYLFEAPGEPNIAYQCNYAIRRFISESHVDPARTWIKTMDVDTVLGESVLDDLVRNINAGLPIIEVAAKYTKNYQDLKLVQRWHAAYQDFWSLDFEQFHGLVKNKWQFAYAPISGAGGTFRLDILKRLGWFPEHVVAEDLALGFKVNQEQIPIATIHSRVESDVPDSFHEGFAQEVRWAEGSIDAAIFGFQNIRKNNRHAFLPVLYTIWANVVWAGVSPAVATGIFHLFSKRNTVTSYCAKVLIACYTAHFVRLEQIMNTAKLKVLLGALYAPVQMLRISLPWWVAAGKKIFSISELHGIRKSTHE